jgi:hypothetical protein
VIWNWSGPARVTADLCGSPCSLGDRGRGAELALLGGDSVPAQIRDIGHVFKGAIGFWFPTSPVVYQNYMRVRVRTAARANSRTGIYGIFHGRVDGQTQPVAH